MALNDMVQRLTLEVPGVNGAQAKTYINEALMFIYGENLWSFQLQTDGFLTSGLLFPGTSTVGNSVGSITARSFFPTVVGDSIASAAWLAYLTAGNFPLFTQLQIRSPFYSLYNIVAIDPTNPNAIVLTLDRNWMEPAGTQSYMIYQAYYSAPVPDFKRFLNARDTTNNYRINYWDLDQRDLAVQDPQRTVFDNPQYFVPYQTDQRKGSATLGNMLYEMWPHPLSILPYTYQYLRKGPQLVNPSDTIPYPLTEEVVMWRAKVQAFLFKEAQKGEDVQRGSGANWQFLAEASSKEYDVRIKPIKNTDRGLVDLFFTRLDGYFPGAIDGYATMNGQLNLGMM